MPRPDIHGSVGGFGFAVQPHLALQIVGTAAVPLVRVGSLVAILVAQTAASRE